MTIKKIDNTHLLHVVPLFVNEIWQLDEFSIRGKEKRVKGHDIKGKYITVKPRAFERGFPQTPRWVTTVPVQFRPQAPRVIDTFDSAFSSEKAILVCGQLVQDSDQEVVRPQGGL